MTIASLPNTLAHPFWPVKSQVNTQLPLLPDTMTHHKVSLSRNHKMIVSYSKYVYGTYGVSSSYRVLTKGLFHKRFDQVRDCLQYVLRLPTCKRSIVLELLRLWSYYGEVYPKAQQVALESYSSKSTFWRTVLYMEKAGLLKRIPRYVLRPHAQISNLYRLDKLLILIARYLAEHGTAFYEKWLKPYLTIPGSQFWTKTIWLKQLELPPPLL